MLNESKELDISRRLRDSIVPFVFLLCLFIILAALVIWPLLSALAWAAVISFISYPVYRFILTRALGGRYSYLAAGINTLLMLFLLVIPMVGVGFALTHELTRVYGIFADWYPRAKELPLKSIFSMPQLDWLFSIFPNFLDRSLWSDFLSGIAGLLASVLTRMSREFVGNVLKLVYKLLVIVVGVFFMTHDGHRALDFVWDILPLSGEARDTFFTRAKQMLYAIFYGIILTAGVQGALGALGWWYVGLGNPALFGALMFFLAMLPFVGAAMVWVPGVAYLFFVQGDARGAVILLVWGILVSSIDNFMKPLFISEGSKAHLLLIFIGILGGVSTLGFLGIFMGPLILSVAYFLAHLYRLIVISPDGVLSGDDADDIPENGSEA